MNLKTINEAELLEHALQGLMIRRQKVSERIEHLQHHLQQGVIEDRTKNPAAVVLGRVGGKNSRTYLEPKERSELGRRAAQARWGTKTPPRKRRLSAAGLQAIKEAQVRRWKRYHRERRKANA
jgi:hypothetical protein